MLRIKSDMPAIEVSGSLMASWLRHSAVVGSTFANLILTAPLMVAILF
jgi:hypothetical protein